MHGVSVPLHISLPPLLPSPSPQVASRPSGELFAVEEKASEASADLEGKLSQAMAGMTVGAPTENEYVIPLAGVQWVCSGCEVGVPKVCRRGEMGAEVCRGV